MNCLVLDPKTVIVEASEVHQQEQMDKLGMNVIPAGHKGADGVTGSKTLGSVEHVDARGPTREQRHQAHARCARIFRKEPMSGLQWICLLIVFIGMLFGEGLLGFRRTC